MHLCTLADDNDDFGAYLMIDDKTPELSAAEAGFGFIGFGFIVRNGCFVFISYKVATEGTGGSFVSGTFSTSESRQRRLFMELPGDEVEAFSIGLSLSVEETLPWITLVRSDGVLEKFLEEEDEEEEDFL